MTSGNYADIEWLKRKLVVSDEDQDQEFNDAIEAANRFVDDILVRYAATLPVTGDLLTSAIGVANAEAMRDYKLSKQAIDIAREWKTTRDERAKAMIGKLQTDPATNTQNKVVAVSSTYKTQPLKSRTS